MFQNETPLNIGIYVYDNVEVLDFSGPFEVFSTAFRLSKQLNSKVLLISGSGMKINARGSLSVNPHYSILEHPELDILIIAGGVHTKELDRPNITKWISTQAQEVTIIASVCTGSFLLANAGVLNGLTATTHWSDIGEFRNTFPEIPIVENVPWVDHVNVVTSAGISAGIDMSLHLVSRFFSQSLAAQTAKQMEYYWPNQKGVNHVNP